MNFTLKALALRIATDDSEEAVKTAARRIEHWVSMGLFELAGVDIGPRAIGRGRVRKYPEPALPWCFLWTALADRGLGFNAMSTTVQTIQNKLDDKGLQGRWLRQAMKGKGPAVFLFDERAGLIQQSVGQWVVLPYNWKLARSPVRLEDSWSGGFFLNLTAIYAKAASE